MLTKNTPFQKMSKKAQKERNAEKRNTWGLVNPVTRRVESKKAYNRQSAKRETRALFA